jgi:hypothetical protein
MRPVRVEDVAVGVVDDLSGVALNDATGSPDVDGQAHIAAAAVGIEDRRPGVALVDRLAVGGDRGVVVGVEPHLDDVAVPVEVHVEEAVLVLHRDEHVEAPRHTPRCR